MRPSGREDHPARGVEGAGVLGLVERAARRRAAGLEDGPERSGGVARAERGERLVHGGRVVREVVVDADAARLTEQLLPPLHPFERRERRTASRARRPRTPRAHAAIVATAFRTL